MHIMQFIIILVLTDIFFPVKLMTTMARRCVISGVGPLAGNNVSHAHNKTRRVQRPNLHKKRFYIPELKRTVRLKVSARSIRTIDKIGLQSYLRKHNLSLKQVV